MDFSASQLYHDFISQIQNAHGVHNSDQRRQLLACIQQLESPIQTPWASLYPMDANHPRIDLLKGFWRYKFGRLKNQMPPSNLIGSILIPDISDLHCEIAWDGTDTFVIQNLSRDLLLHVQRRDMGKFLAVDECYTIYRGDLVGFGTYSDTDLPTQMRSYAFYSHLTPSLAGTYDINNGKELGSGTFGVVNLTSHRTKGTIHAVKTIKTKPFYLGSPENTRITYEISAMETLKDHPGICRIEEIFFELKDIIHIVMEYVVGGNLFEYIHANIYYNLSEGDIKDIAYQICSAMEYAHAKGIAHRDLKPGNILLTNDKTPVVKVTDFGSAEFFGETPVMTGNVGTKDFLAPEIVTLPSEGYNHSVDCWSMGITMLFMFTTFTDLKAQCLLPSTTLKSSPITYEAQVFIADFLHFIPSLRATFTKALSSLWLQSYRRQVRKAIPLGNWNGNAVNNENVDPDQGLDAIENGTTKIHANQNRKRQAEKVVYRGRAERL